MLCLPVCTGLPISKRHVRSPFVDKHDKQVCIPAGCVPPACCPYLPACTAGEGVVCYRGCVCYHGGCVCYLEGGCLLPGGVSATWEGCVCYLGTGCLLRGGVSATWGCVYIPAYNGADTPHSPMGRQTSVKT